MVICICFLKNSIDFGDSTQIMYLELLKKPSKQITEYSRKSSKNLLLGKIIKDNIYFAELMDEINYFNKIITNLQKAKRNINELFLNKKCYENLIIDEILKYLTNEDVLNVSSI